MIRKARSILKTGFIILNLVVIVFYLSVCLVSFVNTGRHWYFAFCGLIFPLIAFVLVCFLIWWAVARSKWFWVCLVVLLAGMQQIVAVMAFRWPSAFEYKRTAGTLRVMEWNVEGWRKKPEMLDIVRKADADILCFEEYSDKKWNRRLKDSNVNVKALTEAGYPYHHYAVTESFDANVWNGVIIFSKYPIIRSGIYSYGKNTFAEHLIYIDISPGKDTVRVFTTHLQSVRFEHEDYSSLDRLKHAGDPGYRDSRTIASKLKKAFAFRYEQAQMVKEKIAESPYPVILTGDFNDVPNSNTYFTIRGHMQDAFLEKGTGIGRTFRFISPTLRIDYILADKKFKVSQFGIIRVPYSDHYPIIADLQL